MSEAKVDTYGPFHPRTGKTHAALNRSALLLRKRFVRALPIGSLIIGGGLTAAWVGLLSFGFYKLVSYLVS